MGSTKPRSSDTSRVLVGPENPDLMGLVLLGPWLGALFAELDEPAMEYFVFSRGRSTLNVERSSRSSIVHGGRVSPLPQETKAHTRVCAFERN